MEFTNKNRLESIIMSFQYQKFNYKLKYIKNEDSYFICKKEYIQIVEIN